MTIIARGALLAVLAFGLTGCDRPTKQHSTSNVAEAGGADEVGTLKASVAELQKDVSGLRGELLIQRLRLNAYDTAELDPADPSFARVDGFGGFGSFAVSIYNVEPYGDGVRITLRLGNLTMATFRHVKLTLHYGTRKPDIGMAAAEYNTAYDAWSNSLKEKKIELTSDITAGSWNPTPIVLPAIKPADFGYLKVSLEANEMILRVQ
jgi:hypothetical protein